MKFLTDQDVYATTTRLLEGLGYDVVRAASIGMSRASDEDLLQEAHSQERILVTRDRGFGGLVFAQGREAGVIYLRMIPSTINQVHDELERVLSLYDESLLREVLVVVEPARHRVRRRPNPPIGP